MKATHLILGAQVPTAPAGAGGVPGWLPEWAQREVLLLATWQWLGLLALVAAAVLLDRLAALVGRRLARRVVGLAERLRAPVPEAEGEALASAAGRPLGLCLAAGGAWCAWPLLALPDPSAAFGRGALEVLLAVALVWTAYRAVDLGSLFLAGLAARTATRLDDMLVPLARRTGKLFVVAIGGVFVAQNQGIEVGSLLAGLGIGGLALALAAKDTLANVFGSVTVITDQPFTIGDWVVVAGHEGIVERVGLRSTRLRTFHDSLVTVPNARLIDGVIDNFGRRRHRRYSTRFGIAYDTPVWKVEAFCEALRELVRRHPAARQDGWHVYLNDLGDSSLQVLVYLFFAVPTWADELAARHAFLAAALRAAEALGVEYAFPTRTVHLARAAPAAAAPSSPPPPPDLAGALALGREVAAHVAARP